MKRAVCFHGHFYQPPRENPGLAIVEPQPSAAPFSDWNERITAECYARNATARVLDEHGALARLVNNYASLSFDFGATLTSWFDRHHPEVSAAIVEGDRRFGGAIAHPLHHVILPLASARDRDAEIQLGLAEFERRFGRKARGFWLPETAADVATLEALAAHGVEFTYLAPRQAARVRPLAPTTSEWCDVRDGSVDPRIPYLVRLPSGRTLNVVFYDGVVSQAVAFERLLDSADLLVKRVLAAFDAKAKHAQLVTVCTDGETYGHHHRFGEMALARAVEVLRDEHGIDVTTGERFLDGNPPLYEVEIVSPSAWSCAHGVERWRSNCGCRIGAPGSSQAWRTPLREALDRLRDDAAAVFEDETRDLLIDPWAARASGLALYSSRRNDSEIEAFLRLHQRRESSSVERTTVLELLEAQRQSLAMFTSCAFFFDDVAGIETLQVLAHADRVLELTQRATGRDLSGPFLALLERAESNERGKGNAAQLYATEVRPQRGDPRRIAQHCALHALIDEEGAKRGDCETPHVADHRVVLRHARRVREGAATMASGIAAITCPIGGREFEFTFVAIESAPLEFAVCVIDGGDLHLLRRCEDDFLRDPRATRFQLERRAESTATRLAVLLPCARKAFVRSSLDALLREEREVRRRLLAAVDRCADEFSQHAVDLPAEVMWAREAEIESRVLDSLVSGRLDASTLEAMRGVEFVSADVLTRIQEWLAETMRISLRKRDDGSSLRTFQAIFESAWLAAPRIDREPLQAELRRFVDEVLATWWRDAATDRATRSRVDALLDVCRRVGVKAAP